LNNLTYKHPSDEYFNSIKQWYRTRFIKDPRKEIKDEEILTSCSVFTMSNVAVSYFSERGDGILVFTPCYMPYYNIIRVLGRIPIEV
jgi:bifunctional pyridoxal-dependent enzyme with beta-cystathionase and maltose regulon repressor activities